MNETITIRIGTPILRPGLVIETCVSGRYVGSAIHNLMAIARKYNAECNESIAKNPPCSAHDSESNRFDESLLQGQLVKFRRDKDNPHDIIGKSDPDAAREYIRQMREARPVGDPMSDLINKYPLTIDDINTERGLDISIAEQGKKDYNNFIDNINRGMVCHVGPNEDMGHATIHKVEKKEDTYTYAAGIDPIDPPPAHEPFPHSTEDAADKVESDHITDQLF